jgi:hypothetical protein
MMSHEKHIQRNRPKCRSPQTQEVLEDELERLKQIMKQGYELTVHWIPKNDSKISGEVIGDQIYIYDTKLEVAMETLKHEFMDYYISKVIEPYKEVTNKLIEMINEQAYQRKEKCVDELCRLV